jgi:REP element-mobilizing transposase RayT
MYPHVALDAYVIMPNHMHGIIVLTREVPGVGLSDVVRVFKSDAALRINRLRNARGTAVWQRSFYDHVIRNDDIDLERIRWYILNNPAQWADDKLNRDDP